MPIVLNGSGPVTGVTSLNTTVSDTEIGYLDGVTSALQTQINTAGGLVKITDATFSAQSAVNVNNCFSSTYDNYRVIIEITAATNNAFVDFRLRASGTDNTTTNYQRQFLNPSGTTVGASRALGANLFSQIGYATSTSGPTSIIFDIVAPQAARQTMLQANDCHGGNGGINFEQYLTVGVFSANTQFDGFSFFSTGSNITGTFRVYGYRN